ncbi:MAG: hypothetical protein HYR88_10575 [Verrucomicrobia bacterium]|nr:hypothetical protein [Verrucomicrobiota bacterium]MBI3869891.1 hypothetical protein [Verrucomicrobiota bacterium]
MRPRIHPTLNLALLCAGWAVVGASRAEAQVTGDWTRHFRLGSVAALNLKGDFSLAGSFVTPPRSAGAAAGDILYDDGYVRQDATGNAGQLSSYWGYQGAGQYNAGAGTMLFHSSSSFTANTPSSREDNQVDAGLEAGYGGVLALWGRTLVGWDLGFTYLPIGIKDTRSLGVNLARDLFTHAIGFTPPQAPYNGGPSGVGPLIGSAPTAAGSDNIAATLVGKRSIDTTLYNFKLGPTFYWDMGRRWSLQAGAGGALGFLNGAYKYQEVAIAADGGQTPLSGRFGKSSLTYGGYAGAMLLWHTAEKADVYLGAQYMTLGGTTYGGVGREARLRLGNGIYVSVGVNWPF